MTINYWRKDAIELRFTECEHTIFIPRGHSTGHKNCYGCNPELAKVPLPGCCEFCKSKHRDSSANPDSPVEGSALGIQRAAH